MVVGDHPQEEVCPRHVGDALALLLLGEEVEEVPLHEVEDMVPVMA